MAKRKSEDYLISKKLDFAFPSKTVNVLNHRTSVNMLMERRKYVS
jgi:hypothetical protein